MKISVGQLLDSTEAITELAATKLPAATAMRVKLVLDASRAPLQAFNDAYNQLLQDTGKPREDDKARYDITDIVRFQEQMAELRATEVEIPLTEKIHVDKLGSADMTARALLALDWMIQA